MASQRDLVIRFLGDSKGLQRAAKEAISSLDGTETKGEAVAKALKAMADQSEAEMEAAAGAAEALAAAIGDELRAEVESAGGSIDQYIADLKRAGLTYDDIRADADQLGDALVRLQTSGRQAGDGIKAGATEAATGLDQVRASGDNSRSVLANMVGNSAQDLGALGGVAGTAGMAIGQLAEYATEGNISLSGLAKFAGPMLGVGAAVAAVTAVMEAQKRAAEEMRKEIEALKVVQESLAQGDADTAAEKLLEQYRDTIPMLEKYGFAAEDLVGTLQGETAAVNQLRAQREQLDGQIRMDTTLTNVQKKALRDQRDELDALIKTLGEAPQAYDEAAAALQFETRATEELSAALADGTARKEYYASRVAAATTTVRQAKQTEEEIAASLEESARYTERVTTAVEARRQAEQDLRNELLAAIDSNYAYRVAADRAADALDEYNEQVASGKLNAEELDDATRETGRTLYETAAAYAEAQGAAEGSDEAIRLMLDNLKLQAAALDPNSPLRKELDAYIADLEAIPKEVTTNLKVLRQGDVGFERRATGGPVKAGEPYIVGEEGPELVVPAASGTVLDAAKTRQVLSPTSGTGVAATAGTYVVNIFTNQDPNATILAQRRWERRNGAMS